ncbi:MAG: DUF4292 domain-containing protein [Tannerella sp.]|jgi:hypothetical protein|nr:DUF4292 domain-containing protein [Tannerella sp.]
MKKNKRYVTTMARWCLISLPLFTACRTPQNAVVSTTKTLAAEELFFDALCQNAFQYQTLSAKLQIGLVTADGKEYNVRANMKIRKDEQIQISVQPFLGIEMFRIELKPDSFRVTDRMNKRYMADDYTHLKGDNSFDFNFYNLQALITNQLFLPGETELPVRTFNRFHWAPAGQGYLMQTEDSTGWCYLFRANIDEKIHAVEISDTTKRLSLFWDYADFKPVGHQVFPMNIHARVVSGDSIPADFSMTYTNLETDMPLEFRSGIPSGYQRISVAQLIKSFEKP